MSVLLGTVQYDNYGNQTERTGGGVTWNFIYDTSYNRLKQLKKNGSTLMADFYYDALGRRIERYDRVNSIDRYYLYDGNNLIAETNASKSIIAWYTPGICESRFDGGVWKTYYYHTDGLGSTREMTDGIERVAEAYSYNAWGEEMGKMPNPAPGVSKPENPLRFAGKHGCYSDGVYTTDATESGLVLMGARYYDPFIGRFITQDPAKDGLNWYAYADNNPMNAIDPFGLDALVFSGEKLKLFDDNGSLVTWVPAYSGDPGRDKSSFVNFADPIPPGLYNINFDNAGWWTSSKLTGLRSDYWYGSASEHEAWGDVRVPVVPQNTKDWESKYGSKGRDWESFYLHGGKYIGSHGCIDIGNNDSSFVETIIRRGGGTLPLTVDYSGWNGSVPAIPGKHGSDARLTWPVFEMWAR